MTVEQIILALIGVPGSVDVEIVDEDGIAADIVHINFSGSHGSIYCEAVIDRKMLADDEMAVKS